LSVEPKFNMKQMTARLEAIPSPPDEIGFPSGQLVDPNTTANLHVTAATAAMTGITPPNGYAAPNIPSPPSIDNIKTLKSALRGAQDIEFATIPMYLTALWSIVDQDHLAAKALRAIVHEEMLHLAIVCNLLSGLGDRPVLTGPRAPTFPGKFPGNVHPNLVLKLQGYCDDSLNTFLQIERPDKRIKIMNGQREVPQRFSRGSYTIGRFYRALIAGFRKLDKEIDLKPELQVAGPFAWRVMTTFDEVQEALDIIMYQGEGTGKIPYDKNPLQLSHYYRFKSLQLQHHLKWNAKAKVLEVKKPISPPSVLALAPPPPPPESYGPAAPRKVREANAKFEDTYSLMLQCLEGSWRHGGENSFVKAIDLMFDLGALARTIMQIETPDHLGYCPTFRCLA
jgi:hypothetical protein